MRRRISLYIADNLVDLDKDSLVLFNYTMEDLTNPTIVKNSYSQQITLKGTINNNLLFGSIFRLDRVIGDQGGNINADYNPSQKTPFAIYNEVGEILESGYCKLDTITRKGQDIEYKVSLYGGLGSFLYSLAYDEEGNKKTLASLDYLGTDNTESELDFIINKDNVAAAWGTNTFDDEIDSKWKVINFAPAYNGIPEGNFAPDKALVKPSLVGLQNSITTDPGTADEKIYTTQQDYALVNLVQQYDEWAVKDLRSYLQRPVFSMFAFLEAVKKPMNNGGYDVNMPFLEKIDFGRFKHLWMTLPLIPSIGTSKQASGDLTLTLSNTPTSNKAMARFTIDGDVPFGTKVTTNVNVKMQFNIPNVTEPNLMSRATTTIGRITWGFQSVFFIQVVAHAADDTIVGGSPVKSLYAWNLTPSQMADRCGYVPPFSLGENTFEARNYTMQTYNKIQDTNYYLLNTDLGFTIEAQDVAYYEVHVTTYRIQTQEAMGQDGKITRSIRETTGGNNCLPTLYKDYDLGYSANVGQILQGANENTITYTSAESLRSGATITKAMLLSTSQTPADYLLSFCKIFGLHLLFDKATKVVTIVDRNDLYQDETIDMTKRVDLSKPIGITPFLFNSKWYDFQLEGVGGAFFDEYKSVQGIDYGIQRVNTGYDFNADTKNLLDGNVFKNAATVLAKSKYFTMVKVGGQLRPSPFMDQGNKYLLWDTNGDSLETDIPVPPYSATIDYYNEYGHPGYDIESARKMEFRSADNKPIDGTGVLVFWEGFNTYPYFNLSDDVPAMDLINDGVPCWILTPGASTGVRVPIFQRYEYGSYWTIEESLDFGVPREMDIPQIDYGQDKTLYARFWQRYLRDRYDVNTKVMTCKVDFGGMRVGYDLLRKFYWYDNSIWVLNKIKNYSLTTYDPVECEFVQVQDKNNYLNGQL